jgi:S-adenosylmethionine:tRNA ribosyltransferase-isomerase
MHPASQPRHDRSDTRLLAVDRDTGSVRDGAIADLPGLLRPGDLLVVNDAATLPASLRARTADDQDVELRLTGALDGDRARAVVFGAGDWRTPTERRPAPPALRPGDRLVFTPGPEGHVLEDLHALAATVLAVDPRTPRLLDLRFDRDGAALWSALYALGRPVQYSYLAAPLDLWSVQTAFAARPWAAEMPSAARPLAWSTLLALRRAGVGIAALTHAAGLSSTGDPDLDAALPLPERYDLPAATIAAISATRARGGRVIAVGTTVVRALEGCVAERGELRPGPGETRLVLTAAFVPRVVDGLLTGMHDPSESHFHLLRAFAREPVLLAAWRHANAGAYLQHEFGDATLLVPDLPRAA